MSDAETHTAIVPAASGGQRFDQVLVQLFPDYSRARLQQWIKNGQVHVDGKLLRPKDKLMGGEVIELRVSAEARASDRHTTEPP